MCALVFSIFLARVPSRFRSFLFSVSQFHKIEVCPRAFVHYYSLSFIRRYKCALALSFVFIILKSQFYKKCALVFSVFFQSTKKWGEIDDFVYILLAIITLFLLFNLKLSQVLNYVYYANQKSYILQSSLNPWEDSDFLQYFTTNHA